MRARCRPGDRHETAPRKALRARLPGVFPACPQTGLLYMKKSPGAFLRASPEGVKHMDVLSTKKPDQYLCQGRTATYHSTPVCHRRYTLPRLASSSLLQGNSAAFHHSGFLTCSSANRTSWPTSATAFADRCSSTPNAWKRKVIASSN